ncbi:MAG TPA: hypothetical protein PLI19_04860 [Erysipelotrichaceae bacterium]|jgi:hypothetical protein|nr:hypothetical protein [Erysipelotrichaceae bacterium]
MDFNYVEFKQEIVQGTESEIRQKYGEGWFVLRLGFSKKYWLVTRQSDITVNGKSYRDFALSFYKEKKLTAKLFEKFKKDVAKGRIRVF